MASALLEVKGLQTQFHTEEGVVHSVDGVDFSIQREQTLGIVGESGCGKSVTALSILRLIQPPGRIAGGSILLKRNNEMVDLARLDPKGPEIRAIRGNEIAMIFQEPMTSLSPVYNIGDQIMETVILHQKLNRKQAGQKAIELLKAVGIPAPEQRIAEYPHQLSGGMRQRAMIAMALSCNPSLLIADEPTTALDVTIQGQVLDLMVGLRERYRMAILFITHDLGVIAKMADTVAVMYLGKIVERGSVGEIFHNPLHPYTVGLLNSLPSLSSTGRKRLEPIKGTVPDPFERPKGCGFRTRCNKVQDDCAIKRPALVEVTPDHFAACHLVSPKGVK